MSAASQQGIGAALTIVGVSITVLGLNGMKFFQNKYGQNPLHMASEKRVKWFGTLSVWILGQLLMMFAADFATASVCGAVSNFALIVNALVAYLVSGESFTVVPDLKRAPKSLMDWDLGAVCLIIIGAVMITTSAPDLPNIVHACTIDAECTSNTCLSTGNCGDYSIEYELTFLHRPAFVALLVLVLAALVTCVIVTCTMKTTILHGVAYGAIAGFCGGFTYAATKLGFVVIDEKGIWSNGPFYAFWIVGGLFELVNIVSLNTGMYKTQAMVVIPAYYVFQTISTALLGLSLYNLFELFDPSTACDFIFGILFVLFGVVIVTHPFSSDRQEQVKQDTIRRQSSLKGSKLGIGSLHFSEHPDPPEIEATNYELMESRAS